MAASKLPEFWVSKARLETLLDGVFAIAMTLMVLEIKLPELKDPRSMTEFGSAMKHNVPGLLAFLISMGMLGIFWYRHHRQYHFIARITPGLLAINLGFLTMVAFFPFAAGVLGKYPMNHGSFVIYLPSAFLLTLMIALQWRHALRHGLFVEDLAPEAARLIALENRMGLALVGTLVVLYLGTIVLIHRFGLDPSILGLAGLALPPLVLWMKRWKKRHGLA